METDAHSRPEQHGVEHGDTSVRVRGVPVSRLSGEDVLAILEGRVPESQELEYKRELPGRKDEDKREFLADVSSFANTTGGVILYGVETGKDSEGRDNGIPEGIASIAPSVGEAEILRLAQILHHGLSPRLSGEELRIVELTDGKRVMALGLRRSLHAPHMVWFDRNGKVWARKGAHKDQVDAVELRRMFLESSGWVDDAEAFRAQRVDTAIKLSETNNWIAPDEGGRVLLHVLPLGRLRRRLDLRPHEADLRDQGISLLRGGANPRYNFDGYLLPGGGVRKWRPAVQWFRSGAVDWRTADFMEQDTTVLACSARTS